MSCEVAEPIAITTLKKVCDFPSAQLLAYRRRLSAQADREDQPDRVRDIMHAVLKIDQLRTLHEDIDGCNCWYMAAAR
jgi:hypothetical protein